MISPLAHIHPKAVLGNGVTVEPFTTIADNVTIGDNTWIGPNATIMSGARIGKGCKIFPGAVISAIPQDLKFIGEETTVEIGDNTTIREFVTVNRGTADKMKTAIGNNCLVMAYVHIAHDCILGNNIILANNVGLAGHVEVEDYAILEGLVGVQQFIKIGAHAFVAGASLVRKNVPPFCKAAREPIAYMGVNAVGLRRRGFSDEIIAQIEDIYRIIFIKGHSTSKAMEIIASEIPSSKEKEAILQFIRQSENGIIRSPV